MIENAKHSAQQLIPAQPANLATICLLIRRHAFPILCKTPTAYSTQTKSAVSASTQQLQSTFPKAAVFPSQLRIL